MELTALKNFTHIAGSSIMVMDNLKKDRPELFNESGSMDYKAFEKDIRPLYPVQIRHDKNSISFSLGEDFDSDCSVETMIEASRMLIHKFNEKQPNERLRFAAQHLADAIYSLEQRKKDRVRRQVEGTSKP